MEKCPPGEKNASRAEKYFAGEKRVKKKNISKHRFDEFKKIKKGLSNCYTVEGYMQNSFFLVKIYVNVTHYAFSSSEIYLSDTMSCRAVVEVLICWYDNNLVRV